MRLSHFRLIVLLIIPFILSTCGGMKKSWEESGKYTINPDSGSQYIWKKGKQYIALVQTIPVATRDSKKTIHPVNLSPEIIRASFSKLKYKNKVTKDIKPVFSEGNIQLLSSKLSEALRKAKRNQDVLFEVFQLRKKFWILPTTVDTTAGYIFVERGRINIIFEKINEDHQGYDYDEPRAITGKASEGIYGGRVKVSKGWVVLTKKSWQ